MKHGQTSYAIFPHRGEFAVCHLGYAKAPMTQLFESCWIIDEICPCEKTAAEALNRRVKENKIRRASDLADQEALARRRNRA